MGKTIEKDARLWCMRLDMTRQLLFSAVKRIAEQSECDSFRSHTAVKWFSGYDYSKSRMLPDGNIVLGGPTNSDIRMRDEIIATVLDALKSRQRPGFLLPCALYKLSQLEYDFTLALCQLYITISKMVAEGDQLNPYEAASAETTANAILTTMRLEDHPEMIQILSRPVDDDDLSACPL